jgi:hypothetical protein
VKNVMGTDGVTARWRAATVDVDQTARHADPSAVYGKNNAFWRALQQTAIHVALADEAPSKSQLAKEAIKDSVTRLPSTLKTAASGAVHAVEAIADAGIEVLADTAHAAGRVVNQAAKGVFSGVGTPLVIGAGVLGAYLLFRGGRRHEEA